MHVIEKLIDIYYQKEGTKEIRFLSEFHSQLARRDNVKLTYKHNAFHVNAALTRPDIVSIESTNLLCASYYGN